MLDNLAARDDADRYLYYDDVILPSPHNLAVNRFSFNFFWNAASRLAGTCGRHAHAANLLLVTG
jgi:hypothetical protein